MFSNRKPRYYQDASSSQLDLQVQCNPNQNPKKLFCGFHQNDSKVYIERQKTTLKENKLGGPTLPNFKTYYKATVTQTVWYQWKNRQINGTECRAQKQTLVNVVNFYLVNFDREAKATQWNKDSLSNKWCWNNRTSTHIKINLNTDLSLFTAISTNINQCWWRARQYKAFWICPYGPGIGRTQTSEPGGVQIPASSKRDLHPSPTSSPPPVTWSP